MDYLTWAAIGLVAGAIARILHPGKDPGGCVVTPLLGVAGAFIGGFAARKLGFAGVEAFDLRSIGISVAGALLLLIVYRAAFGNKDD